MENVVEFHSEVESEVLNQEPSGHSSNAEQNGIEIFEKNESISDEEINLQFTSSIDSETDGSSAEKPQQFALTLQKSVPVGSKLTQRPNTAKALKFINKNKSTKLGFGYRPKDELIEEQELPVSDGDNVSEQDSDVSQDESVENVAPAAKRRKVSLTAVPQRRSSRVANLKMSQSMSKRGRSKSMTTVEKSEMPAKKVRATSRKRTHSNARSHSRTNANSNSHSKASSHSRSNARSHSRPNARRRSRSKSARSRKASKSTKAAPMKRRATKRRRRASKK